MPIEFNFPGVIASDSSFAEIYINGGTTTQVTNASAGVYNTITGFNAFAGKNGLSVECVPDKANSKITCVREGVYQASFVCSFTGGDTVNFFVELYNLTQSVSVDSCRGKQRYGGSNPAIISFQGLVNVAAGDEFVVRVAASGGGHNFTPEFANFQMRRVGNEYFPPEFAPNQLENLIFWLRSDTGTLLSGSSATDGQGIDTWTEMLAGTANPVQATSAWRPTLRTNQLNGFPVVRFDNSSVTSLFAQHMRVPNANLPSTFLGLGTGECSVFVVYKPVNFTLTHYLLTKANLHVNSQVPILQLLSSSGYIGIGTGGGVYFSTLDAVEAAAWNRVGISRKETGDMRYYLDGALVEAQTLFSGAGDNSLELFLGARADGTLYGDNGAAGLNGDLAELLVFSRQLTEGEVVTLDNYFKARYAL